MRFFFEMNIVKGWLGESLALNEPVRPVRGGFVSFAAAPARRRGVSRAVDASGGRARSCSRACAFCCLDGGLGRASEHVRGSRRRSGVPRAGLAASL